MNPTTLIIAASAFGGFVLVAATATYLLAKAAYWNVQAELIRTSLPRTRKQVERDDKLLGRV